VSDDTNSEFDPRFDPAFQRGFDSAIPIEESVPAPAARVLAQPAPVELAPAPSAAPSTAHPVSVPGGETPQVPEDAAPVLVDQALLLPDSAPSRSNRNPFLLVVLVLAIVLIVGGIVMLVQTGDAFNSSQVLSQGDFNTLASMIDFAPFVSLLGVATAIGLLFVLANSWRKRH
jgi:hypothetical protein